MTPPDLSAKNRMPQGRPEFSKSGQEALLKAQEVYENDPNIENREADNKARGNLIMAYDNDPSYWKQKYPGNPVIIPPPGFGLLEFRDPTTGWADQKNGNWFLTIGSQLNKTGWIPALGSGYRLINLVPVITTKFFKTPPLPLVPDPCPLLPSVQFFQNSTWYQSQFPGTFSNPRFFFLTHGAATVASPAATPRSPLFDRLTSITTAAAPAHVGLIITVSRRYYLRFHGKLRNKEGSATGGANVATNSNALGLTPDQMTRLLSMLDVSSDKDTGSNGEASAREWLIDSGASHHMTGLCHEDGDWTG
ncbi:hypothetical protein DM860_012279 [Cuscuta australis]|uniref:Glycosyl hydrolase family 32 N-terminal domain-containing protein n=1 Tax=Cuscuta australis TaxID=267555 RepID=A0A328E6M1_9ASTE|nr:hypothetical protein DM860_012279 [Cuscuta australis]